MFLVFFLLALGLPLFDGHSWVDIVGRDGGHMRGFKKGATDEDLQRYVCDKATLAECQPDPKHNVIYTDDAMFPCRLDDGRIKASRVVSGDNLYIMWMGNGHANAQSFGQPVDFYITPYKSRPSFNELKPLVQVPYFYCEDGSPVCRRPKTDTLLSLPTQAGKYTVFWKWPFTDFIYGSCFDVEVLPIGSKPPTAVPVTPATVNGTNSADHDTSEYLQYGCKLDIECLGVGEEYCKLWQKDNCGRSVCHGSDISLQQCSPAPIGGGTIPPSNGSFGPGSFCKCWQNPPVCHGTDVPCVCDKSKIALRSTGGEVN